MADVYLNRISRADTNVILDSILTYYTDMSDKQIQNDDNCSFITMSDRLTQNDNNYSPSVMMNPIAIRDIGEFPLPPRVVHATSYDCYPSSVDVMACPAEPKHNVMTGFRKIPRVRQLAAEHIQDSISSLETRNAPQLFENGETSKPIVSEGDCVSQSVMNGEHQQSLIEYPMTNVHSVKSQLGEKDYVQDGSSKRPLFTRYKLDGKQDLHKDKGSRKDLPPYIEKNPFSVPACGGQRTPNRDGSVSSTGQSLHDSAFAGSQNVQSEDVIGTRQISKLTCNQKHSPESSADRDSTSERTTSPVLPPYDLFQQEFSDFQNTRVSNNRLSYISLSSKMGSLNLSSTSLDDSDHSGPCHHVEDLGSNVCDFHTSDRDQFWSSQDLLLHSSNCFNIDPMVPDSISSGEILQHDQLSLTGQDPSAEETRSNKDRRAGIAKFVGHYGSHTQLQTQNLPHGVGSIERRHANALLLSPQPQRLFSSFIYGERPEINLFEDHLGKNHKIEDVTRSISEETDILFPSQESVHEIVHGQDKHSNSRNRHNTPHHAKMTWPLPSYRIDQGGTRQRSYTQPPPSWKWDAHNGLEVQLDSNSESLPTFTDQITSETKLQSASENTRLFHNQEAISEHGTTPTASSPQPRSELESRFVYTPEHQKPLPALPEDLDSSAIVTFPLSREVPLPEFATVGTGKRRTLKTATSLNSLLSIKRSFSMPLLDVGGSKPVPILTEQSAMITEEEDPSLTHDSISHERDVQDACVVRSDNTDINSHIQRHRWSTSSWGAGARLSVDGTSMKMQHVTRKRKPLKGCGVPWRQFWHSLSFSKPKRRISVSKSSMKT